MCADQSLSKGDSKQIVMFFNYFQGGDLEPAEESTERVHKICKNPHIHCLLILCDPF